MHAHAPIIVEFDYVDPFEAARRLAGQARLTFLDSAMPHATLGRWSFLACEPFGVFRVTEGLAHWNDTPERDEPLAALRHRINANRRPRIGNGPPFQGGAIGHFAYEAGPLFEPAAVALKDHHPQIDLAFFDRLFAFDVIDRRAFAISPDGNLSLPTGPATRSLPSPTITGWADSRTRSAFEAEVADVIEHIRSGDIFQANIAHHFSAQPSVPVDAIAIYDALRTANPAPFGALLVNGDGFVASTSPERFLRLAGRDVETRPIKGTRRRADDAMDDQHSAADLARSEKDRAENTMIVDLLRNDLSRVCEASSVAVPVLCGIESYASVHHLVSVVTGRLEQGCDVLDLIAATFPGGSITGAPKIKAMEIIAATEKAPRGPYCGAIGWIDFCGDADLNIAIRTLVCRDGRMSLHAGGGITLLSDPAAEWEETLAKAERILSALGGSA